MCVYIHRNKIYLKHINKIITYNICTIYLYPFLLFSRQENKCASCFSILSEGRTLITVPVFLSVGRCLSYVFVIIAHSNLT